MLTAAERDSLIGKIEALPDQLEALISPATDAQLLTPYKPGGWNSRQVVHHLADSHMNAYIRSKLILTEDNPPLKPYDQDAWAALADGGTGPLATSLDILRGLHARWAAFFRALPEDAWTRAGLHPENGPMTLERILIAYTTHGEAHLGHIRLGLGL
jgi:hypothetical protein